MGQSLLPVSIPTAASPSVWAGDRLSQKGPEYYKGLTEQFDKFVTEHKLFLVLSLLGMEKTRTISLLTTGIKTHNLINVSRDIIYEALKSLNIGVKILVRRSRAMCDN